MQILPWFLLRGTVLDSQDTAHALDGARYSAIRRDTARYGAIRCDTARSAKTLVQSRIGVLTFVQRGLVFTRNVVLIDALPTMETAEAAVDSGPWDRGIARDRSGSLGIARGRSGTLGNARERSGTAGSLLVARENVCFVIGGTVKSRISPTTHSLTFVGFFARVRLALCSEELQRWNRVVPRSCRAPAAHLQLPQLRSSCLVVQRDGAGRRAPHRERCILLRRVSCCCCKRCC